MTLQKNRGHVRHWSMTSRSKPTPAAAAAFRGPAKAPALRLTLQKGRGCVRQPGGKPHT